MIKKFLIALLCFALPLSASIEKLKIKSPAIGDSTRIIVATPTDYTGTDLSVTGMIIMLHGWSGDETQWEDDSELQFLCDRYSVILVLPDGGYDGWWIDPPNSSKRRYAKHLHDELIPWVEQRYNFTTTKNTRGILGLSMGGFGSVVQVFRYPHAYAAAASLSGVMDLTRVQDRYGIVTALGSFDKHEARWREVNPLDLAKTPAPEGFPALLMICGWEDRFFPENEDTFEALRSSGYDVRFMAAPGTHSHQFWKDHVEQAILFITAQFEPDQD